MTSHDFATMARDVFGFLEQRSFAFSWNGGYGVRFHTSMVCVDVHYDATRSDELEVMIGLMAGVSHEVKRRFMISEMLRVTGHPDLGKATRFVQCRADEVRSRLEWLAGLLREHCSRLLDGDLALFEALDEQQDADCRDYAMRRELARATREAGQAWQQRNYGDVVRQLEPLARYLPPAEKMRLEIARKRSHSA